MSTSFIPAPGNILIETPEPKDNILVLPTDEDRELSGIVAAVGESLTTDFNAVIKSPVNVGDMILHKTIGFERIELDHKEYKVVPFQNILGVVKTNEQ